MTQPPIDRQPVVAIVYFGDPDFSPHIRRCAGSLAACGYRTWALGIRRPKQLQHSSSPFYRTDALRSPSFAAEGPLAFLYFFVGIFVKLWHERPDKLQPFDAPALVPCWLYGLLRGIPIHYFSLEDMPNLPVLEHRPIARAIWIMLEGFCIRRTASVAMVAGIDADSYQSRYGIRRPFIVRNVPERMTIADARSRLLRKRFGWNGNEKVLVYHGLIQKGRGIELVFPLLAKYAWLKLAVAGYGDYEDTLKQEARKQGVESGVGWYGPFRHEDLGRILPDADCGIVVLENISRGYYQALPCKMFEYVHAGVPVIASDFPEMKAYVEQTGVGRCVDPADPAAIESAVLLLLTNSAVADSCRMSCARERNRTCWETESAVYYSFLGIHRQAP